jgi:hypothetical protein
MPQTKRTRLKLARRAHEEAAELDRRSKKTSDLLERMAKRIREDREWSSQDGFEDEALAYMLERAAEELRATEPRRGIVTERPVATTSSGIAIPRAHVPALIEHGARALAIAGAVMDYCSGDKWEREATAKEREEFDRLYEAIFPNQKGGA